MGRASGNPLQLENMAFQTKAWVSDTVSSSRRLMFQREVEGEPQTLIFLFPVSVTDQPLTYPVLMPQPFSFKGKRDRERKKLREQKEPIMSRVSQICFYPTQVRAEPSTRRGVLLHTSLSNSPQTLTYLGQAKISELILSLPPAPEGTGK